jgi:hypothetical protein
VLHGYPPSSPFTPGLDAINAAVNDAAPNLAVSLAHAAGIAVVFAAAARRLRRLA